MTQEQREARSRESVPVELVLIRHAEPDWERGKISGDPGLTEFGRMQAARTAANLQGRTIDALYCSPLQRARETAQAIAAIQQLTPRIVDDLEEIRVPALLNLTQSEVDSYFAAAARRTLKDRWSGFPGGESFRDFHSRVTSAMASVLGHYRIHSLEKEEFAVWRAPARGQPLRIAVVAHGGTNAVILAHFLGIAPVPWEWLRFETVLSAASILSLRNINDDDYIWSLQRFGWRQE